MPSVRPQSGFTLIELSIVLVIIGLIVGGVLVGMDLVKGAEVRAQIAQIEKYQTAVNTFKGKFGSLPGDILASKAAMFGFTTRILNAGQGDGDGVVEGVNASGPGHNYGSAGETGEIALFWVDLTIANGLNVNLVDGSFSTATANTFPGPVSPDPYMPKARIGHENYVYVWSYNGVNYFGLSAMNNLNSWTNGLPGLSAHQAFQIDQKVDDGLPQTGTVIARYQWNGNTGTPRWAGNGFAFGVAPGGTAPATASTCYDNAGVASAVMKYSMGYNGGENVNCGVSFRFQ